MLTPWFMSPWQATRMVIEAHRLMSVSVLRLLSGTNPRTAARRVNDDRDAPDTAEESEATRPHKTVAAHRAREVDKKRDRPRNKRSKRKGKGKSR
jgi:hypothetical protein